MSHVELSVEQVINLATTAINKLEMSREKAISNEKMRAKKSMMKLWTWKYIRRREPTDEELLKEISTHVFLPGAHIPSMLYRINKNYDSKAESIKKLLSAANNLKEDSYRTYNGNPKKIQVSVEEFNTMKELAK